MKIISRQKEKIHLQYPFFIYLLFSICFLSIPDPLSAQGIMLPQDTSLEPLELKSHRVNVEILHAVAKTTVNQVFHSNCSNNIEATYIFPIPQEAAVSDFAIYIDGKKKSGEVLEKGEAEKIYQEIVSRMKDPGILDYMGGKLFRARIFPIPPHSDQQVEISFTQTLSAYKNMNMYIYPLRTGGKSPTTKEDFTITVKIKAQDPIKTIYSPTHKIDIQMNGQKEAIVGFEKNQVTLSSNFVLYYGLTEDRIGLNVLTHRTGDKIGTFLLMLAPGAVSSESEVLTKHVTFVLDTSGSMNGEKIKGARNALSYCLKKLNKNEKFNVVRFSSTAELFFEKPVEASSENIEEALKKIETLNAAGGTAIESALKLAMNQKNYEKALPHYIVFITDGMPTVGTTDPGSLTKIISELNINNPSRIFAFGLGEDVNANFLDMLTSGNHGVSRYAETGEELEFVLERFYNGITYPAMTDVSLSVEGIGASEIFPQKIPDIFFGDQITVAGRYSAGATAKIILIGKIGNKIKKITYTRNVPDEDPENEFIEHIWATRKVGYLLDQIRLNGESQELKDEVIALARRYGIVTPYTSYLVVEDNIGPLPEDIPVPPPPPPIPVSPYYGGLPEEETPAFTAPTKSIAKKEAQKHDAMKTLQESAGSLSSSAAMGKNGKKMSETISEMKNADVDEGGITKLVSGKLFIYRSGIWIDEKFDKKMKLLKIKFGSNGYFYLIKIKPEMKKILKLGTNVIVVVDKGRAIAVLEKCDTPSDENEVKKFFK